MGDACTYKALPFSGDANRPVPWSLHAQPTLKAFSHQINSLSEQQFFCSPGLWGPQNSHKHNEAPALYRSHSQKGSVELLPCKLPPRFKDANSKVETCNTDVGGLTRSCQLKKYAAGSHHNSGNIPPSTRPDDARC